MLHVAGACTVTSAYTCAYTCAHRCALTCEWKVVAEPYSVSPISTQSINILWTKFRIIEPYLSRCLMLLE